MFTTRMVQSDDLPFLWNMLWEAAAVDPRMRSLGKSAALANPATSRYLTNWGRPGDAGMVACDESEQLLGAAWLRLFPLEDPGYGFIAADIPELAISVESEVRGRGVGSILLDALLATAKGRSYRAVSLAVDRQNPALKLYERKGFRDAGISDPTATGLTMIMTL